MLLKTLALAVALLSLTVTVTIVECNTRVDITLSASALPSMDIFDGAPDPYAIVNYSFAPDVQYIKIGETQYFDDVRECEWPEVFTFDYVSTGSQQRVKIDVMDYDWDEDDDIGYVEFYLSELINSFGYTLERNITGFTNQGRLTIKGRINETDVKTSKLAGETDSELGIVNIRLDAINAKTIIVE